MGVHYTLVQQKNERIDKNNLVFELYENEDPGSIYNLKNSCGNLSLQLKIKNISDNYGYTIGLFKICGCAIYPMGDSFPYWAVSPKSCIAISEIRVNNGDDQLILVHKALGENYYYLLLSISGKKINTIEKAGKCDFEFLQNAIRETDKTEKTVNVFQENFTTKKALMTQRKEIKERKEATRPNKNPIQDGFGLIISANGEPLTDIKLLFALRKERSRLAEKKKD